MPRLLPATELMVADLPERAYLLDPILTSNTLALLYGPRGLGKTFVALGIAWAAASGASFLNWTASRPHRVLYIDGEMAAIALRERMRLLGSAPSTLQFLVADLSIHSLPDLGYYEGATSTRVVGRLASGLPTVQGIATTYPLTPPRTYGVEFQYKF